MVTAILQKILFFLLELCFFFLFWSFLTTIYLPFFKSESIQNSQLHWAPFTYYKSDLTFGARGACCSLYYFEDEYRAACCSLYYFEDEYLSSGEQYLKNSKNLCFSVNIQKKCSYRFYLNFGILMKDVLVTK